MELALSLGDSPTPFTFLDKTPKLANNKDPLFSASLGSTFTTSKSPEDHQKSVSPQLELEDTRRTILTDPPFQLQLLPAAPVLQNRTSSKLHIPWFSDKQFVTEPGSNLDGPGKGFDVNRIPTANRTEETEDGTTMSSPNSTVSSFHLEFSVRNGRKRDLDVEVERASDDEEINGSTRKKLRLTKEQSAFLEESFKEHSTLNPKQKIALAKQLNLRPRQVEVWFQNRRARTKLKQTEVECEYLKRCCEKLTEENRRLQKEVQELRALKTTSQPFFMQLPATTLTMCPSCERTVTTTTNSNSNSNSRQKLLPFSNIQNQKLKSSTSNKNPVS